MSTTQRLSDLLPGGWCVVQAMPSGAQMIRLRELGILPGMRIGVVRRAPLGDPIEISVRGALLSLRRAEADLIEVTAA